MTASESHFSEPWFKIRMDIGPYFLPPDRPLVGREEREREGNKRLAQKVGSCLMCSGWPLSNTQEECWTKKDLVGDLMRRKLTSKDLNLFRLT